MTFHIHSALTMWLSTVCKSFFQFQREVIPKSIGRLTELSTFNPITTPCKQQPNQTAPRSSRAFTVIESYNSLALWLRFKDARLFVRGPTNQHCRLRENAEHPQSTTKSFELVHTLCVGFSVRGCYFFLTVSGIRICIHPNYTPFGVMYLHSTSTVISIIHCNTNHWTLCRPELMGKIIQRNLECNLGGCLFLISNVEHVLAWLHQFDFYNLDDL